MSYFPFSYPGNVGTNRSGASPPNSPSDGTNSATLTWNGASLVVLGVFPVNASRLQAEVVNTTGQEIVLAIDDGSNGGLNMMPLDPAGLNTQGGCFRTNVERGRIRIFGAPGTYVYAREN